MSSKTLWLSGIVLLGAVLRLLYFCEIRASPDFDSPDMDAAYHDYWARGYVTGEWVPSNAPTDPHFLTTPYFRPPGYPFFLSSIYRLLGADYRYPRIVQFLLGTLCILLAYLLGNRVFGGYAGLVFAFFSAVYWTFIYFEGELLEPCLMCFLMLVFLHALRLWQGSRSARHAVACGLVCGLLSLVRPNALVFVLPVGIWMFWESGRAARPFLKTASVFLLGVAVVIAPATARNWVKARDTVLISSNAGINLYIGNHEGANGYSASGPAIGGWTCFDYPRVVAEYERKLGRPIKYSEMSRNFAQLALRYMREHPAEAARLWWTKTLLFWGPLDVGNEKEDECERAHSRVLSLIPVRFSVALTLFLLGIALFVRSRTGGLTNSGDSGAERTRQTRFMSLVLMLVFCYFFSLLPFFVAGRYRAPIIPCMLLIAAYAVDRLVALMRSRSPEMLIWIPAAVIVLGVTSVNYAEYVPREADWHLLRGTAYTRKEKLVDAREEFERALAYDPANSVAHKTLGDIAVLDGAANEAVRHYEIAVAGNRNDESSLNNLAWLLVSAGEGSQERFARALGFARRACELTSDSNPRYLDTLAECCWRAGRRDEAIRVLRKALTLESARRDQKVFDELKAKLDSYERQGK